MASCNKPLRIVVLKEGLMLLGSVLGVRSNRTVELENYPGGVEGLSSG